MKVTVFFRIWAVIDAPYNEHALQDFFSYDILPIFALLLTGASFILYNSILLKNSNRQPVKWLVLTILYLMITAGIIMLSRELIQVYYAIVDLGSFHKFFQDFDLHFYIASYLRPILIILTWSCLFGLVERKKDEDIVVKKTYNKRNPMVLLPISAFLWACAGVVNFVAEIIPRLQNRVLYSWEMNGNSVGIIAGIIESYIATQLFYILIGILLFIIWRWSGSKGMITNE